MKDKMTLDIRELKNEKEKTRCDRVWLFISHSDPEQYNLEMRWAVGWRKRDDWWGVLALFPLTHINGINDIAKEMKLAKKAIEILRGGKELPKPNYID